MNSSLNFDNACEQWLPENSVLAFYCNNKKVGEYEIDLSLYITREPAPEKVMIPLTDSDL